MPELNPAPTELTTAATDLLVAVLCVYAVLRLGRVARPSHWRTRLWQGVFALTGLGALLGALAHGLAWPQAVGAALWHPLYLALGLAVALILVGALHDRWGVDTARRALVPMLLVGTGAYVVTQALDGAFVVFLLYEGGATLAALGIYAHIARRGTHAGAGTIAAGLALNLVAAAVQASDLSFTLVWPFDHNGLFHLVLLPALALVLIGVGKGEEVNRGPPGA